MSNLGETFDTSSLPEGTNNFDPLPAGWYEANITQAELKDTKSGTGQYIKVRYDITGPTHQGRVVFGNINIRNQNQQAEEIGRQQLGDIMRAIGLARVTDTDQLVGGSLKIKLSVREQEGYEPTNDVKGFKSLNGSEAPASTASAPKASASSSAPPWAKK